MVADIGSVDIDFAGMGSVDSGFAGTGFAGIDYVGVGFVGTGFDFRNYFAGTVQVLKFVGKLFDPVRTFQKIVQMAMIGNPNYRIVRTRRRRRTPKSQKPCPFGMYM